MTLQDRKNAFAELGKRLQKLDQNTLDKLALSAVNENNWFTKQNVLSALAAWSDQLEMEKIDHWTASLSEEPKDAKSIGLILAGNIPLVGLHDLLSVLIVGHKAVVKRSSQDSALINFVVKQLIDLAPDFAKEIQFTERMNEADAVIATGSDNTARYFKQYFGQKPHIIRQNRTSIGVLNGQEDDQAIATLGKDIFTYYGLGCRNVSKVFVPEDIDLKAFITNLMPYESVIEHHKYRNNYDYNKSIYLVNNEPHLDSGFFLMRETSDLVSPISVLFYETYQKEADLALKLATVADKTQCIVSDRAWYPNSITFGEAQYPELWDYADGVDTLEFLTKL
jgi:hypothetical protein